MQIKSLAQGENILMLGIEPSTFVSKIDILTTTPIVHINVYDKNGNNVRLVNHDCLPILMLLYIMLYIVLAYLMLFAALSDTVCLYNASFFAIYFCKCFLFSCFFFVY